MSGVGVGVGAPAAAASASGSSSFLLYEEEEGKDSAPVVVCIATSRPPPPSSASASSAPSSGAGSGGSICLACPRTGSILASSDGMKFPMGVSSFSAFVPPPDHDDSDDSTTLAIAFGRSSSSSSSGTAAASSDDDTYGALVAIRPCGGGGIGASSGSQSLSSSSSAAAARWRCRLPEPRMSGGLLASPCGRYVVGGGESGTLYAWRTSSSSSGRGRADSSSSPLVGIARGAHYRSVTAMAWSTNNTASTSSSANSASAATSMLLTGGADGAVHVFTLRSLVAADGGGGGEETGGGGGAAAVHPIRSWSDHTLPVTSIVPLGGGRVATASKDGRVLILELCSGSVLAEISLQAAGGPVTCLAYHCQNGTGTGTLYAGTGRGTIYAVDLGARAVHRTAQLGAAIAGGANDRGSAGAAAGSRFDRVFGGGSGSGRSEALGDGGGGGNRQLSSELRGHDRAVTALAVVVGGGGGGFGTDDDLLVSGDEGGCVRMWDLASRGCIRSMYPWSTPSPAPAPASAGSKASQSKAAKWSPNHHPITSITVLPERRRSSPRPADGAPLFGAIGRPALSRRSAYGASSSAGAFGPLQKFPAQVRELETVPVRSTQRRSRRCWDVSSSRFDARAALAKRRRRARRGTAEPAPPPPAEQTTPGELERLRRELDQANATIQRWERVNNKLMARLQQQDCGNSNT